MLSVVGPASNLHPHNPFYGCQLDQRFSKERFYSRDGNMWSRKLVALCQLYGASFTLLVVQRAISKTRNEFEGKVWSADPLRHPGA